MNLEAQIESLLFVSAKPMTAKMLANFGIGKAKEIEESLEKLLKQYEAEKRGIRLIKNNSEYQMVSAPENSALAQKLSKEELNSELSRPSLETLTIIAYRQPISKIDLERIRGINCSLILRNLAMRGLISADFDKEKQDAYYTVTMNFVRYLGLSQLSELPDYEKLAQDDSIERMLQTV